MANQDIEKLYEEVFDLVYSQVQNDNRGVLYKVIHILFETKKSEADKLCINIGINQDASLDEDEDHYKDLITDKRFQNNSWLAQKLRNFNFTVMNPDMAKVIWIVFIGCLIVGLPLCIVYLNNKKPKSRSNRESHSPPSESLPPHTAALCLVVSASIFNDVKNKNQNQLQDNNLDISELEALIDNALYFLCTTVEDAKLKEQSLEITNEDIPTDISPEVYIRIDINNGQEMIGKEVPYILKRNLQSTGKRILQRSNYLKNLSGLEQFNRV